MPTCWKCKKDLDAWNLFGACPHCGEGWRLRRVLDGVLLVLIVSAAIGAFVSVWWLILSCIAVGITVLALFVAAIKRNR